MERIVLTCEERHQIGRLVHAAIDGTDRWDPFQFVDRATVLAESMPVRLREFLAGVRSNETDVAMVSGLPVRSDLPPTPSRWDLAAKTGAGDREEAVLLLCGSILGDPFGWTSQQDGRIVHDVCPAPGMEQSMTSASSEASLSLHTEDVFHPCRGDYVSLYCLRNPDAVGTTFTRISSLDLPAELRSVLSENRFQFFPDDSHVGAVLTGVDTEDHLAGRHFVRGQVVFGPPERPYLRFDVDFMSADDGDDEAALAITAMQGRLASATERVVLRPGDAVFIDNYRVVHGREPFAARYDGTDRWLKRLNLTRDIRRAYLAGTRSRLLG